MRQAEKGDGLIWILEKEYKQKNQAYCGMHCLDRPVFYWYETDFE